MQLRLRLCDRKDLRAYTFSLLPGHGAEPQIKGWTGGTAGLPMQADETAGSNFGVDATSSELSPVDLCLAVA